MTRTFSVALVFLSFLAFFCLAESETVYLAFTGLKEFSVVDGEYSVVLSEEVVVDDVDSGKFSSNLHFEDKGTATFKVDSGESGDYELTIENILDIIVHPSRETEEEIFESADLVGISYASENEFLKPVTSHEDVCRVFVSEDYGSYVPADYDEEDYGEDVGDSNGLVVEVIPEDENFLSVNFAYHFDGIPIIPIMLPFYIEECESGEVRGPFFAMSLSGLNWKELKDYGEADFDPSNEPDMIFGNKHNDNFASGGYDFGDKPQSITLHWQFAKNADLIKEFDYEYISEELWINFELLGGDETPGEYNGNIDEYREAEITVKRVASSQAGLDLLGVTDDFESQMESPDYVISAGANAENPFEDADYDSSKFLYQSIAVKEMSFVWDTQASTFNGNAGLPPGIYELTLTAFNEDEDEYDSRTIYIDLQEEESAWPHTYQFALSNAKQTALGLIDVDQNAAGGFRFRITADDNTFYEFSYDAAPVMLDDEFTFDLNRASYRGVFTAFEETPFSGDADFSEGLCGNSCWTLTLTDGQAGEAPAGGSTGDAGAPSDDSMAGRVAMAPDNPLALFKPIPLYFVAKIIAKVPGIEKTHEFNGDQPRFMLCLDDLGECFKITKISDTEPVTDANFNVEKFVPNAETDFKEEAHVLVFVKFDDVFGSLATEEQKSAIQAAAGVVYLTDTQGNLDNAVTCLDTQYALSPRPAFSNALQACLAAEAPAIMDKIEPIIGHLNELAVRAASGEGEAITELEDLIRAFVSQLPASMQASVNAKIDTLITALRAEQITVGAISNIGNGEIVSGVSTVIGVGAEVLSQTPLAGNAGDLALEIPPMPDFSASAPGSILTLFGDIGNEVVTEFTSLFAEPTPEQYAQMCEKAYELSTQHKVMVWAPTAPHGVGGFLSTFFGNGIWVVSGSLIDARPRVQELGFNGMFDALSDSQGGKECFNEDAALIKGTNDDDVETLEAAFPYCTRGSMESVLSFDTPAPVTGGTAGSTGSTGASATVLPEPVSPCSAFEPSSLIGLQDNGWIDCQNCQNYYIYVDGVAPSRASDAFTINENSKPRAFSDAGTASGVQYGSFTLGHEYWVTVFDSQGTKCYQDKYVAYPTSYCFYFFPSNSDAQYVLGSGALISGSEAYGATNPVYRNTDTTDLSTGNEEIKYYNECTIWYGSHPVRFFIKEKYFPGLATVASEEISGVIYSHEYFGSIECDLSNYDALNDPNTRQTYFDNWLTGECNAPFTRLTTSAPSYSTLSPAGETVATTRATDAIVDAVAAPAPAGVAVAQSLPLDVETPEDPVVSAPPSSEPAPVQPPAVAPAASGSDMFSVDIPVTNDEVNGLCDLMAKGASNCPNNPQLTAGDLNTFCTAYKIDLLRVGTLESLNAKLAGCLSNQEINSLVSKLDVWCSAQWFTIPNIQSVLTHCQTTASTAGYEYRAMASGSLSDKRRVSVLFSRKALASVSSLLLTETTGYQPAAPVGESDLPFLFAELSRVPESELASARERSKEQLCDLTRELSADGEILVDWGYQENAFDYAVKFLPWFFGLSRDRPDWKGAAGYGAALTGPNSCFVREAVIGPDQEEYVRVTTLRESLGK